MSRYFVNLSVVRGPETRHRESPWGAVELHLGGGLAVPACRTAFRGSFVRILCPLRKACSVTSPVLIVGVFPSVPVILSV